MVMQARKHPRATDGYHEETRGHLYEDVTALKHRDSRGYAGSEDHINSLKRRRENSPRQRYKGREDLHDDRARDSYRAINSNHRSGGKEQQADRETNDHYQNRAAEKRSGEVQQVGEIQKVALRVCGDWSEHRSSSGKIYYYNCKTEVSKWDKPKEWTLPDLAAKSKSSSHDSFAKEKDCHTSKGGHDSRDGHDSFVTSVGSEISKILSTPDKGGNASWRNASASTASANQSSNHAAHSKSGGIKSQLSTPLEQDAARDLLKPEAAGSRVAASRADQRYREDGIDRNYPARGGSKLAAGSNSREDRYSSAAKQGRYDMPQSGTAGSTSRNAIEGRDAYSACDSADGRMLNASASASSDWNLAKDTGAGIAQVQQVLGSAGAGVAGGGGVLEEQRVSRESINGASKTGSRRRSSADVTTDMEISPGSTPTEESALARLLYQHHPQSAPALSPGAFARNLPVVAATEGGASALPAQQQSPAAVMGALLNHLVSVGATLQSTTGAPDPAAQLPVPKGWTAQQTIDALGKLQQILQQQQQKRQLAQQVQERLQLQKPQPPQVLHQPSERQLQQQELLNQLNRNLQSPASSLAAAAVPSPPSPMESDGTPIASPVGSRRQSANGAAEGREWSRGGGGSCSFEGSSLVVENGEGISRTCNHPGLSPSTSSFSRGGATPSETPYSFASQQSGGPLATSQLALAAAAHSRRDSAAQPYYLSPSLAHYYDSRLTSHVTGWQAESIERQTRKYLEEFHFVTSAYCAQISTRLNRHRSFVRIAEIKSTLLEQRLLFLRQQVYELENGGRAQYRYAASDGT